MRLYLDCCCLQRPWDDQTQLRIRVETEALIAVLSEVQAGKLHLLASEALDYEIRRIPDIHRQTDTQAVLDLAAEYLQLTSVREQLALELQAKGIDAMDAVHLALASVSKADHFVTTDDKLLKKAQMMKNLNCQTTSLLSLVSEIT